VTTASRSALLGSNQDEDSLYVFAGECTHRAVARTCQRLSVSLPRLAADTVGPAQPNSPCGDLLFDQYNYDGHGEEIVPARGAAGVVPAEAGAMATLRARS
jgi:hypothetical protein